MRASVVIFAIMIFASCKNKDGSTEIIIEGDVKGLPDGKVYLTDADHWTINLDSATATNGHFVFRIKPDSSFYPYLARIRFPDANSAIRLGGLMFENTRSTGFYLEKGVTTISGDTAKSYRVSTGGLMIRCNVKAGKQNDAYVGNLMNDFGWLGNLDSAKRNDRIKYFKNQIKTYPYSYFLLDGIFNARNQYSKFEWTELLSLFNEDVQLSALGKKVKKYLSVRRDPDSPYPNISLMNAVNERKKIFDNNVMINMVVFWASWCGPCREEIPFLKKIYAKYKNRNLNLSSISVDESEDEWKKAMQKEDMPWPQFIVEKKEKEFIDVQFDPSIIPLIIFTNKAGYQIAKFVGYEKGQENKYDSIISHYVSKN